MDEWEAVQSEALRETVHLGSTFLPKSAKASQEFSYIVLKSSLRMLSTAIAKRPGADSARKI
jgi:hypothetical protein